MASAQARDSVERTVQVLAEALPLGNRATAPLPGEGPIPADLVGVVVDSGRPRCGDVGPGGVEQTGASGRVGDRVARHVDVPRVGSLAAVLEADDPAAVAP